MREIEPFLQTSCARHARLCPRQVLGVRMGLLAGDLLSLTLPQADKRLLAIAETDGCAADGISAATGCWVGRRTLRIEDLGKVAATFVDTCTEVAVRIAPQPDARQLAQAYAPAAESRWEAQLIGYQRMPDELLLAWQEVALATPLATLIGQAGLRVSCQACGEEVINGRELVRDGLTLCRSCAEGAYYRPLAPSFLLPLAAPAELDTVNRW